MIDISITRAAKTNMQLEINQAVADQPWRKHSRDLTSNEETETFEGLGHWPAVREFIGEANYDFLKKLAFTVDSKTWQLGTAFKRQDLKTAAGKQVVMTRLPLLAQSFAGHPNGLMFTLIEDTSSTSTIDGLTFFNTSHTIAGSSTTWSNLITGTGTAAAQIIADFYSTIKAIGGVQNRAGDRVFENVGKLKLTVLHPNDLDQKMHEVFLKYPITGDTTQGALRHYDVSLESYDRLTDTSDWYVKIENFPMLQPFFFFKVKNPTFEWDETDKVKKLMVSYSGHAIYKMHYGYPIVIYKINNS